MLCKDDLELQTEAFLGFAGKLKNQDLPLEHVFRYWADSKDLEPEDEAAIWRLVQEKNLLSQ